MSGIYLHIPFCKKACHYCDFHFSTSLQNKEAFISALLKEIKNRASYLEDQKINTIYFGGGTPSLLSKDELLLIISKIKQVFNVQPKAEITLEANPDDLSQEKTKEFFEIGINRLSIGIQTFQDDILLKLNRSHTSSQATDCIKNARESHFQNINIDLIFGLPGSTLNSFKIDVDKLIDLNPEHISAYWLTIEEKTVFGNWHKKGKLQSLEDQVALQQWSYLKKRLNSAGYIQYEISNFSKPSLESNHNSNYWKGINYLGLGPSAHSFNGFERSWNISNNAKYISSIQKEEQYITTEVLSREDKINEHIMTRLRTVWGIDLPYLKDTLNFDLLQSHKVTLEHHLNTNEILINNNCITLTDKGQQFADQIASNLFI